MQTDKATALIRMDLPPALGPVINKESGSFPPSSIVLEMIFSAFNKGWKKASNKSSLSERTDIVPLKAFPYLTLARYRMFQ